MAKEENLVTQRERTPEERRRIASMGGKASGKKRRERKTIANALRAVMDEPIAKGEKKTKLEAIAVKVVKKLFDNPDIRDLKVLAEILGEVKQNIEANGLAINITASQEGKDNIEKILDGE